MYSEEVVLRLVGQIYACAEGTVDWRAFLDDLTKVACASITSITVHNLNRPASSVMSYTGADTSEFNKYVAHYMNINPWFARGVSGFPEGHIISTDNVMPRKLFRTTAFYHEWGKRNEVTHALGGSISIEGSSLCFLAVNRGESHPDFGEKEKRGLQILMPHLRRAVDLHNRLGLMEEQRWVLDALAFPLFHVAKDRTVLWMNREAEKLAKRGVGLYLKQGQLHAEAAGQDARLGALISSERQSSPSDLQGWGGWLRIDGRNQEQLSLYIVRPPGKVGHLMASPSSAHGFLVFVATQSLTSGNLGGRLREIWGLTPTECALCLELLESETLAAASEQMGITRNTAKTHLNAIFLKAGVRRQGELMRKVLAIAALGDPSSLR